MRQTSPFIGFPGEGLAGALIESSAGRWPRVTLEDLEKEKEGLGIAEKLVDTPVLGVCEELPRIVGIIRRNRQDVGRRL